MALSESDIDEIVRSSLSPQEQGSAVAYVSKQVYSPGTKLSMPGVERIVEEPSRLAFIDSHPLANWGHDCRYLLVNASTGQVEPIRARFPPISGEKRDDWRLSYRAEGVDAAFLLVGH